MNDIVSLPHDIQLNSTDDWSTLSTVGKIVKASGTGDDNTINTNFMEIQQDLRKIKQQMRLAGVAI
jgi:hypothetical protein